MTTLSGQALEPLGLLVLVAFGDFDTLIQRP
jgi:hypothetical protein